MSSVLEVRGLGKRYPGVTVLEDLNFSIEKKGVFALLGVNGAGKTTLLNCLSACCPFEQGLVRLAGLNLQSQRERALQALAYMPALLPLYPELTLRESLDFVEALAGTTKRDVKMSERRRFLLSRLELIDVQDRLIRHLSSGYQQRIGIAQSFLMDRPLVLLDEPGLGLDPWQRKSFRELLIEEGKQRSILLSSHDLAEVESVADELLILDRGRLVARHEARDLLSRKSANESLSVVVQGPVAQVHRLLRAIEGVHHVEVMEQSEDLGRYELRLRPDRQPQRAMMRQLAQSNFVLLELSSARPGLESLFMEQSRS